MANNILNKIINKKVQRIIELKKNVSIESLKKKIDQNKTYIDFKKKIENNILKNKISLIAEIKKASPSAGIIVENYNPVDIAKKYLDNKATCLSVLTEEDFFLGNLIHMHKIKEKINLPILCKDFFIDPFQVYKAKAASADAILIILAAVSQQTAEELYSVSEDLGMNAIVEVHNTEEATQALKFKKAIIGINNRNLKTLETNIQTTYDLHKILKNHQGPIVCESGIKSEIEVEEIVKKTGINNFLIGESLLKDLNGKSSLLKRIVQIKA